MDLFPRRLARFRSVIANRQQNLTIILENVHDPHNIGAVLRTCDSVGIAEVYVIYTDPGLQERGLSVGHKSSSGARQWITLHYFEEISLCMFAVKEKYDRIYGTRIEENSSDLYDLDLSGSCALLFGNEHQGISDEAAKYVDVNFIIPQHGFVKSLNISVACAVSLYEAQRQRKHKGLYDREFGDREEDGNMLEKFLQINLDKKLPKG